MRKAQERESWRKTERPMPSTVSMWAEYDDVDDDNDEIHNGKICLHSLSFAEEVIILVTLQYPC